MSDFKIGDVVRLRSGGPLMTASVIYPDGVVVAWFADYKVYRDQFSPDMLMRIDEQSGDDSNGEMSPEEYDDYRCAVMAEALSSQPNAHIEGDTANLHLPSDPPPTDPDALPDPEQEALVQRIMRIGPYVTWSLATREESHKMHTDTARVFVRACSHNSERICALKRDIERMEAFLGIDPLSHD